MEQRSRPTSDTENHIRRTRYGKDVDDAEVTPYLAHRARACHFGIAHATSARRWAEALQR